MDLKMELALDPISLFLIGKSKRVKWMKKHTTVKPDALIMHPGPMNRGIEIDSELADDINRSVIHEQVEMGVAVRMACLDIVTRNLSRNSSGTE